MVKVKMMKPDLEMIHREERVMELMRNSLKAGEKMMPMNMMKMQSPVLDQRRKKKAKRVKQAKKAKTRKARMT